MGYYIYELYNAADTSLPRFVGVGQHGAPSNWQTIWTHRMRWQGRLAAWLRTLETMPVEKILLGQSVPLEAEQARAVARARVQWVNKAATGSDQPASFLANEESVNRRRGGKRCTLLVDGKVETFDTITSAGKACGVSREAVSRQLRRGVLSRRGRL